MTRSAQRIPFQTLGAPSQSAVDACAPYGGITGYEEGDYDWTAYCSNGMACHGGAEGGAAPVCTQKVACAPNRQYAGPDQGCVCMPGFVDDPNNPADWGGPKACIPAGGLKVPVAAGTPCFDAAGGAGVTDTQGQCVVGPVYQASPGDDCTGPDGRKGSYNTAMTCIVPAGAPADPPKNPPGTPPGTPPGQNPPGKGPGVQPVVTSSTPWPWVAAGVAVLLVGGAVVYTKTRK